MAVLQGLTRLQLRQYIAPVLGGYVSSASAQGTTTTLIDNTLSMGAASDNAQKGKWIDFTSGTNSGLISQVTSSTVATSITTHTFAPARTQTESADTYILWPQWLPPSTINRLIDDAILKATGRFYDPVEYLGFKGDGRTYKFTFPTTMTMIRKLFYRSNVESKDIHLCNAVWTTDIDADVTASLDSKDYKEGGGSLKMVVAAGATAGDIIAAEAITSADLSGYDYVEFWAKASAAAAAAAFKLHLHSGAIADNPNATDTLEQLSLPALTANTWTFCRVALANPRSDTAITRVGLELDADATITVWLDEIRVVLDGSAEWIEVPQQAWDVEQEGRLLVLSGDAVNLIGSNAMKVIGGDKPALLTADSTVTEVSERYIIAYVVYQSLLACRDEFLRQAIPDWRDELRRARNALPLLYGVRPVE